MKGVRIYEPGDSSVLRLECDIPVPSVSDSHVLVRVEYAGINFVDVYQRTGVYPVHPRPFIAGREGAGIIVQAGSAVPSSCGLSVGDRVAVFAQGTMAEYISVPTSGGSMMKLPPAISTEHGAALMLQGLTAWTLVRDAYDVRAGETVLVQAAAGGTGGLLVQMCKHLGATAIGTVSTREKAAVARGHGCDHVILYREESVEEQVMDLTEGKGCHAVFSGVGKATFMADLACTRRKGTLVSYGNSSGVVDGFRILELSKKNVKLVRPTLANYLAEEAEFVQRSTELMELVQSGAVHANVDQVYRLEELGQAQDNLEQQKTTGKLLVRINYNQS